MEEYFTENKHYEILHEEKSFQHVRLNDTIEQIKNYDDEFSVMIKEKLNRANMFSYNNITKKEIDVKKDINKDTNIHKETEITNKKFIEKILQGASKYNNISLSVNNNINYNIAINFCSSGNKLVRSIIIDDLYLHLYENKSQFYDLYCNGISLYIKNTNVSEIPYLYIDNNSEKKYVLFLIKNINEIPIKNSDNIYSLSNAKIEIIQNYNIKYKLNIIKYLLINKNKLKYLIYFMMYYCNKSSVFLSENKNNVIDFAMVLYNIKTQDFIDNNTIHVLTTFITLFENDKNESKIYFNDQLYNLYCLIIHCSLQNNIMKNKNKTINKILKYSNIYHDVNIKNIENNDNYCHMIALKLFYKLDISIQKMICNILMIEHDNKDDIEKYLIYFIK